MVVAWLEVHVDGCAGGAAPSLFKRNPFRVRLAGFFMPTLPQNLFVESQNTANSRIRSGGVQTFRGELERTPHHGVVKSAEPGHLRLLRVDLTSCTASRKSSGVSKLR